jgi:hypothetical protein
MIRRVLLVVALMASPLASADDISGFWKHTEEPGWIEISLEQGKGTVVRNDKFPERVGRELLKDLVEDDSQQGLWRGLVYAEKLGEYKDAEVTLPEPNRMRIKVKIGFMSRTFEWEHVNAMP